MTLPLPSFSPKVRPTGRGYRRPRCSGCRAPLEFCFCAELTRVSCDIRVIVAMHSTEYKRPTNTGLYACQVLENAELRLRGERSADLRPIPMATEDLLPPDSGTLVLHPGPNAEVLDASFKWDEKPKRLIIPDGTWSQTRQMLRREPALKELRRVVLPKGPPSIYALRHTTQADGLCTLEAIIRCLEFFREENAAAHLRHILLIALKAGMAARGVLNWQPRVP